jgi:hypothetical protein
MNMQLDLLNQPWEIQLILASGYAAYVVAYTGLRERQKTVDIAFISLVFSVLATLILALSLPRVGPIAAGLSAFVGSLVGGVLWRKFGRPIVRWALREADVTWSDDDPSALATLSGSTDFYVTQIAVLLDDGTWLRCDNARQFSGSPFGPCQLGPNGDVALYLTHEEPAQGEAKALTSVRDSYYGDRITYVPAARIKRITIRHVPKKAKNPLTVEVSVQPSQSQREQAGSSVV